MNNLIELSQYQVEASPERMVNAVEEVKQSDCVVIIRGGLTLRDEASWIEYMKTECGLQHDQRHFDFSSRISIADWWEISNQPDKESSYAYSTTPQPFHTDNGWFAHPPEINFFIMKRQAAQGGEQIIYFAKQLVADLRSEDPELLNALATIRVIIQKGNSEERNDTTILCDIDTDNPRVYWNYYRTERTSPEVDQLCERFFQYLQAKTDTDDVLRLRLASGDCLIFNDTRILHGRTAFTATAPRDRVLLQSMWKIM